MRVHLVYPPDRSLPTAPYSSLAVLSAVLKQAGHRVSIVDANLLVHEWIHTTEQLGRYYDAAMGRLEQFESSSAPLDPETNGAYRALMPLAAVPRESILSAPAAAATLRGQEYFEPEKFNRAQDILRALLRLQFAPRPTLDPGTRSFIERALEFAVAARGDPVSEGYRQAVLNRIVGAQSRLVGITIPFQNQILEALHLARLIKDHSPHIKIVLGGQSITTYADRLFETGALFDVIDFAVVDDGEEAMVALTEAIAGRCALTDVPNLNWCEDGEIHAPSSPAPPIDLDACPTPDFEDFPFDRYLVPERCVNLQTSRGCYYGRCTFCNESWRRNVRMRSPDLVYEDLKKIQGAYGVERFLFWDALAPPKTLEGVARRIAGNGDSITWLAETKFERPFGDPDRMAALARGGCRFLQFGLESASQRVLGLMDKGTDPELLERILENARACGIGVGVNWFIGFPSETVDEALQTYRFIVDREDRIALSGYIGEYHLERDTLIHAHPSRFGLRVFEGVDGKPDYEFEDGSRKTDLGALHTKFTVRGDVMAIHGGVGLLYRSRVPDRLRAVTGLGRVGRLIDRTRDDLSSLVVSRYRGTLLGRRRVRRGGNEELVLIAYSPATDCAVDLGSLEQSIVECVDGERTVAEIADSLEEWPRNDLIECLVWLADSGVLRLVSRSEEVRVAAR